MKKRGSITVFLSLTMVLLFSMILTSLEASRIQGASAYLSMVTDLAEDSFLASYYYPLFRNYRIFGVDAGAGTSYFSEEYLKGKMEKPVQNGLMQIEGGVFAWDEAGVELTGYQTLLTNQAEGFLAQVEEQALLEGVSLAVAGLFEEQTFRDAALAGEVYEQQEAALEAVATVTKEFLRLMELVDGIRMSDQGLDLDREGRLQTRSSFLKQILPMDGTEMRTRFDNEEVYRAIEPQLLYLPDKVREIKSLVEEAIQLEGQLQEYDRWLSETEGEKQKVLREERDELVEHLDLVWMDAEDQYAEVKQVIQGVTGCLKETSMVLEVLEKKQAAARLVVAGYEKYLEGRLGQISGELYQVFAKELHTMKLYLGMGAEGYYVPVMKQSVATDLHIISNFRMEGFSKEEPGRLIAEMEQIAHGISGYTAEGLWFTYGDIVLGKPLPGNLWTALGTLLTSSILELAGVEDYSPRQMSGEELPSEGGLGQSVGTGIKAAMQAVKELLLQGEWNGAFYSVAEGITQKAALELYCSTFFGNYTEPCEYTRLLYEKEYLVFGQKKDAQNLLSAVLAILAVRLLLSIAETLKNPERMAQLQSFAIGLVGFTGIPALIATVKYGLLFLWALEEAFVEVAAMMQGKTIAILPGENQIAFVEVFRFSKALVRQKAAAIPEMISGAGYKEYLSLFSLLGPVKRQAYHAMDLIQENIRYRYRDSFRMRNAVVSMQAVVRATLKQKYDAGLFLDKVYQKEQKAECSY